MEKEGVKAERHKARTGSEYASFSHYGVMYEVRNADHTKPRSAYDRANETGVEVTADWDGMIRHIGMDLVQAGMNAADVYALMDEAERFNSEDEAVRRAATEDGVGSAEFRDAYPTLWRVMGLKSLEEARMEARVVEIAEKLHLGKVNVITDVSGLEGRRRGAKGSAAEPFGRCGRGSHHASRGCGAQGS